MTESKKLDGGITELQLSHWKNQYGGVTAIIVPLNDALEGTEVIKVTGYFRKPDLKVIQAAAPFTDSDPVKSGLIQFDNCFLGGDEAFKTNDEVKLSAIQALNKMFKVRVAEIKNL
jgi:hypothetical protein